MATYRKCGPNHEDGVARKCQNSKRSERVHAGMRERVHLVHHQRSFGEVPAGEAQNRQRRGYPVCYDFSWLRELCGSFEDLSFSLSRDPHHKSEQTTSRGVQFQRDQLRCRCRAQRGLWSGRCTATTTRSERRSGNLRKRHHGLRVPPSQRKRNRRLLGESAAPRTVSQVLYRKRPRSSVLACWLLLGQRKRRRWRGSHVLRETGEPDCMEDEEII